MINEFHNMQAVPLSERETFNNTVLLLTMVKSEYYYIVGFSRPDRKIEIAFDFESELHGKICESITMDFGVDLEYVLVKCVLKNVDLSVTELPNGDIFTGEFSVCDGELVYNYKVRKDRLVPVGVEQMHEHILRAKTEIVYFLGVYYRSLLAD